MNRIQQKRWWLVLPLMGMLTIATRAFATGSAENAILIIDPTDPTSLYVGNYYKNARNIPDANVLYMSSAAANYSTFTTTNQKAFAGELLRHNVRDHADYVVIAPFNGFYVPYSGEPTGPGSTQTCSTPQRYSISAASSGTPAGPAPAAYSYSKFASSQNALLLELPASFDAAPNAATYTLLNLPTKATVLQSGSSPSGPYRIIQPLPGATGSEQLQFQVTTPGGVSNVATITVNY